jgi:hypothetical protein
MAAWAFPDPKNKKLPKIKRKIVSHRLIRPLRRNFSEASLWRKKNKTQRKRFRL